MYCYDIYGTYSYVENFDNNLSILDTSSPYLYGFFAHCSYKLKIIIEYFIKFNKLPSKKKYIKLY